MPSSPVIVAMDYADPASALALAERLDPAACRLKVGKELFTVAGPRVVEQMQGLGFEVFLDLKFHDIPNTVAAAVRAAADLGVWMVNVHAAGGRRMLESAAAAVSGYSASPQLIGVTVLTSMDETDYDEVGYALPLSQQVFQLAALCADCGLDGVVCSAREAGELRRARGADFALVTPGIRPAGSSSDDQRRVLTPPEAISAGSSHLVIGRPVTRADDPAAALAAINASLAVS